MRHYLKTWSEYFVAILIGNKTFEVRKNDRDFKVGDTLILQEYNPDTKSMLGREIVKTISYVLHGGQFGIEEGYVVLGFH